MTKELNIIHNIPMKDGSTYRVDPHFGDDVYVNSFDFFKDCVEDFSESFITYFQVDDPEYSLNFVKFDGKELFLSKESYLDDFFELEDGSDEYYSLMKLLDQGDLSVQYLSSLIWKKLK